MIKPQFLQTNHSADISHILYGVSALDVIFSKHTKEKGMSAFMKSSASQLHGSAAQSSGINFSDDHITGFEMSELQHNSISSKLREACTKLRKGDRGYGWLQM